LGPRILRCDDSHSDDDSVMLSLEVRRSKK
jgi:hypothetical protein